MKSICALQKGFPLLSQESGWDVVCDFDGTITPFDVTDALLQRFALPEWEEVEAAWVRGEISARRCMELQVEMLRASQAELDAFLDGVPVDPDFPPLWRECRERSLPCMVVSDGLDYAIRRILSRQGLGAVPVIANRLVRRDNDRWKLEFPYGDHGCPSGVCKCRVAGSGGGRVLLIGDGRSDCCLAQRAHFVLAKQGKELLALCMDRGLAHLAYQDFNNIRAIFRAVAAPVRSSAA